MRTATDERRRDQEALLFRLARAESVAPLLDDVCLLVERHLPGCRAVLRVLDPVTRTLHHGAAPTLDPAFLRAIEGSPIGPEHRACGAAVASGEPVFVADIASDPRWRDYRELAREYGLVACWSWPLKGADGDVLGTLAIYPPEPRDPAVDDLDLVRGAIVMAELVLGRRRRERAVETSELRYRTLFNSIDEGFCLVRVDFDSAGKPLDYTFLETNAKFDRQTGLGDAVGKSARELVPELDESWFETYGEVARSGVPRRFENHSPGMERWFDVYAFRFGEPHERLVGVLFRDVSASKRTEEALRRSEERFRLMAGASADLVWDWDVVSDTVWRYAGGQGGGQPVEEMRREEASAEWEQSIHPDDRSRVIEAFQEAVAGDASDLAISYRVGHEDDRPKLVETRVSMIRDERGRAVRVVGSMVDVTEQRSLADQLAQARRLEALGNLTGGVAHDFNNMLAVVLGNAELLEASLANDERLRMVATTTRQAAERSADLTRRLLAFARRQPLDPRPVDVERVLLELEPLLRRSVGEAVELSIVASAVGSLAMVDASQLAQAVLNLALNARDAMPEGGLLTIEAHEVELDEGYAASHADVEPGSYVLVTVSDTGTGMSAEVAAQAFDPFFTTKDEGHGGGLGLSMVYGFARQSGGHARLYSEPGVGTTARLYLPTATTKREEVPRRDAEEAPVGSETVLVVEDDPLVREHVSQLLSSLGYTVLEAADGASALGILDATPQVSLLFTDMIMPGGMNGRRLAELARSRRPGLPVLFTSGYSRDALVHHGRLDADVRLLTKPYRRAQLASAIREVLDDADN